MSWRDDNPLVCNVPAGAADVSGQARSKYVRREFAAKMNLPAEAVQTADDAWLLKTFVRGIPRTHGKIASFMAKSLKDYAGNRLLTHVSVLHEVGKHTAFANHTFEDTQMLGGGIAYGNG